MDRLREIWDRLIEMFDPNGHIGGLEISETSLEYVGLYGLRNGAAKEISMSLPVGVVESGAVKNAEQLTEALKVLRKQIEPKASKLTDIILTIPASNVYIQAFTVPTLGTATLAEAADLNLRIVSPIDINSAYYGWQKMPGETVSRSGGQVELLGAFVDKKVIDQYVKAVTDAGYTIAAVESSTLALGRSLGANKLVKTNLSYLVVRVESAGVYLMVLKNGVTAFNFFSPWAAIESADKTVPLDSIKNLIQTEVRRVMNFYSSHWGGQISNIIFSSPTIQNELIDHLKQNFKGVEVTTISDDRATAAYGAALRGLIPRSRDNDISLNNVTAHEAYRGSQILRYVAFWRSIVITTFITMLIVFSVADFYLHGVLASESASLNPNLPQGEATVLNSLQGEAGQFNQEVQLVQAAKAEQNHISWLVGDINLAAQADDVILSRVNLQVGNNSGLVVGDASSQSVASDFKNKIAAIPQVSSAQIPLSSIVVAADGSANFTVVFQVTSWTPPAGSYTPPVQVSPQATTTATSTATTSNVLDNSFSASDTTGLGQQLAGLTQSIQATSSSNGPPIIFSNLQFTSFSKPITVDVSAANKSTADALNAALAKSPYFSKLQVSDETITSDNRISYSITFVYISNP